MVRKSRTRTIALWAAVAAAVAAGLWWRSATADERAVRRVFARLSELAEKDGPQDGGGVLGAAAGVGELEELFDERVEVLLPEWSRRPTTRGRVQLARQAMLARHHATRSALRFDGLRVELDAARAAAHVAGDASLTCEMPGWGSVSDATRELRADLVRDPSDGAWRIRRIELTPILRQ